MKKCIIVILLICVMLTGCGIEKRTVTTGYSPNCDGSIDVTTTVRIDGEITSVETSTIQE